MKEAPTKSAPTVEPSDIHGRLRNYLGQVMGQPPATKPDGGEAEAPEDQDLEETSVDEVEDSTVLDEDDDESQPEIPEDEEDEEQEGAEDADANLPPEFLAKKVKGQVNGEEIEITVEEAIKGYQRLQDYTRKSQETAKVRTELKGQIENYRQGLNMVGQFLAADVQAYEKLDWEKLKAEDGVKYALMREEYRDAKDRFEGLRRSWEQASAEQNRLVQEEVQEIILEETSKLAKALPEWNDPAKKTELKTKWAKWGQANGFTIDELNQTIDHRYLLVLNKAMKYDELVQKRQEVGKQKVKKAPRVVKGKENLAAVPKQQKEYKQAATNLKQNQKSLDAVAQVLKHRLKPMER